MDDKKGVEIECPACGQEALLLRQPRYEGLTRVGDVLSCSACGHVFDSEEQVPFKHRAELHVFTDADRSQELEVFDEDEVRICRYCVHYVVNPFTQWCARHKQEVQATDTCAEFEKKEEEASPI